MKDSSENNKTVATKFIEAFNTDDWETVRKVVTPDYVYHHPIGGTVHAGPEGMVAAWSSFKSSLPDSWHPIPIMITDNDYLAVLLPTYGNFTGKPYHNIPSTGKWLEYGMVNIVRFKNGLIAENWLGMDPLAEMQYMGAAPKMPPKQLTTIEKNNIELFQKTINTKDQKFDNLTAFGNIVVALGPPQYERKSNTRKMEIYRVVGEAVELVRSHEFITNPPYSGDSSVNTEQSRNIVKRFIKELLNEHNLDSLAKIAASDILIHPKRCHVKQAIMESMELATG